MRCMADHRPDLSVSRSPSGAVCGTLSCTRVLKRFTAFPTVHLHHWFDGHSPAAPGGISRSGVLRSTTSEHSPELSWLTLRPRPKAPTALPRCAGDVREN